MKDKCCGNCKYFKDEDVNGEGFCEVKYEFEGCCHECDNHEFRNNGWTEITPDNVDMIDDGSIIIVTDGTYYNKASEWHLSIGTMATTMVACGNSELENVWSEYEEVSTAKEEKKVDPNFLIHNDHYQKGKGETK